MNPGASSQGSNEIDKDDKETNFKEKNMSKELSMMTLIRLDTELENALGFREHALKCDDWSEFLVWDNEVNNIVKEIESLGD